MGCAASSFFLGIVVIGRDMSKVAKVMPLIGYYAI